VAREHAAASVGISRTLATYRLDELADTGILPVGYAWPRDRSGPGAGARARRGGRLPIYPNIADTGGEMSDTYVPGTTDTTDIWQRVRRDPAYTAFWLLRIGFMVLPIWMGLDKFVNGLTDWPHYLAPWVVDIATVVGLTAQSAMYIVGVVEIVAGVAVAIKPRYAAYVVAAWLAGIIIDLLTYSGFYDVALRDFGLLVAALTLGLLALAYDRPLGHHATSVGK
jgi:uncharacterized membrane protein YphA (DoxX/SURF4 family)